MEGSERQMEDSLCNHDGREHWEVCFRRGQRQVMGGSAGEGRCSGTGVLEVTPKEILKETGRESTNPPRIPEVKGTKRNGVTD